MLPRSLDELRARQLGVLSRTQVLAAGRTPGDLERHLRRRDLVRVRAGVFVDHTGALTWEQRAWAGVLACWPAALTHRSSLVAHHRAGHDERDIDLVVARDRRISAPTGYRVIRSTAFPGSVAWHLAPPRTTDERTVLDVATGAATELDLVRVLTDACGSRRTTARRLLHASRERPRLGRRALVEEVLADVASGAWSVLEREYVTRVERPHGLPKPHRQARESTGRGVVFRDADLPAFGLLIELDDRTFHEGGRHRDRDLERDLVALVSGRRTVRLGWGQVVGRPCETAVSVARLLRDGGWVGRPVACAPGCPAATVRWS